MGRPNGYAGKIAWTDKRVKPNSDQSIDTTKGSVDLGGSIERFRSVAAAKARKAYISKAEKAAPILGSEYDYVVADCLVRVSRILTPKEAGAYHSAARS